MNQIDKVKQILLLARLQLEIISKNLAKKNIEKSEEYTLEAYKLIEEAFEVLIR